MKELEPHDQKISCFVLSEFRGAAEEAGVESVPLGSLLEIVDRHTIELYEIGQEFLSGFSKQQKLMLYAKIGFVLARAVVTRENYNELLVQTFQPYFERREKTFERRMREVLMSEKANYIPEEWEPVQKTLDKIFPIQETAKTK